MKNISDIEIIESVLKGNESDYTLIIERYKDRAFSLLSNMLKNKLDAEEALQDSFIKAFRSLNTFRKDSKFSTWFYKIVYNTGLTIATNKKRKLQMEMNSIDEIYNLKDEDNEIYATSENAKDYLIKIVDKLPTRNALILILFYIDSFSLKEISEVLDVTVPNVKVLLHRSRNLLREMLIKHNYQEEIL
ncbi:MAG: sigma-70 family RNA polymerase sigma factor [Melioribacteraceae bacterium]